MTFQQPETLLFGERSWSMYSFPLAFRDHTPDYERSLRTIPWEIVKADVGWISPRDSSLQRGYEGRWQIDRHDRLVLCHLEARLVPLEAGPLLMGWAERQSRPLMGGYEVPAGALPADVLGTLVGLVAQPVEPSRLTPRADLRTTYLFTDPDIIVVCDPRDFADLARHQTVTVVPDARSSRPPVEIDPQHAITIDSSDAVFTGDTVRTAVPVHSQASWHRAHLDADGERVRYDNCSVFIRDGSEPLMNDFVPMSALTTGAVRWAEPDDFVFDRFPVPAHWYTGELRLSIEPPIHTSSGGAFELESETRLAVRDGVVQRP